MAFLEGFLLGLGMIVFIGPVFFTLLKSALSYGALVGFIVALGIFISDVVCVILCSFGAIPFFESAQNQFWLAIGGSVVLFGMGLKNLFNPNVDLNTDLQLTAGHYTGYFAKGFLVNFVNPFVFVTWISIIGLAQTRFGSGIDLWFFLGAALLAILLTDSLKVFFAHRIKKVITPNFLRRASQGIGLVMMCFGLRLLWFAIS